jgi:ubiquinone/menaquinone biosynthesis C-methylase UbiE
MALLEIERVVDLCLAGRAIHDVLDVGTGSGLFAEAFAARGLQVAGIDANPEMIEVAQSYVPQGRFKQGVAEVIPFPDHSFDLVFMGVVLHETDDRVQALAEARRVARQRVAILEWPYHEQGPGPPLAYRLKPEQVAALAREAGFEEIETTLLAHTVFHRLDL